MIGVDIVQRQIARLEHDVQVALGCCGDQVAGQLGLAIDHHVPPDQRIEIDPDQPLAIGEVEPALDHAFRVHPRIDAEAAHQPDRDRFQHAGADAAFDIAARLALEDDAFDPLGAQDVAEQQPGRPRTDDGDLGLHARDCLSS